MYPQGVAADEEVAAPAVVEHHVGAVAQWMNKSDGGRQWDVPHFVHRYHFLLGWAIEQLGELEDFVGHALRVDGDAGLQFVHSRFSVATRMIMPSKNSLGTSKAMRHLWVAAGSTWLGLGFISNW